MSSKAAKSNNSRLIVQRDYSLVNNMYGIMLHSAQLNMTAHISDIRAGEATSRLYHIGVTKMRDS